MSAIDGGIQKKMREEGIKLIIEQEDTNDILKIIEALENSGILLKGVSKTIENETKEQRGGFLSMLLDTLGASLLGNLLSGKGLMRAGEGEYENTGTHWIALFVKTNEVIYFDSFGIEHIPKEINKFIGNEQSSSAKARNKKIKANIFRIQAYDSIMCGYFCIEFINYMFKSKTLLDYTNLFFPNGFKKNDQTIKRIFKK